MIEPNKNKTDCNKITLIFKTSTPTEYWDGTWLGMSLSNSIFDTTYVYRLSMKCEGYPEGFSKSGTLTSVH